MSQLQYKHQAMLVLPTRQARNSSKLAAVTFNCRDVAHVCADLDRLFTNKRDHSFLLQNMGCIPHCFPTRSTHSIVRRDTTHSHAQTGLSSLYENVLLRSFSYRECAVTTAAQTQPRGNVAVNKLLSGAP